MLIADSEYEPLPNDERKNWAIILGIGRCQQSNKSNNLTSVSAMLGVLYFMNLLYLIHFTKKQGKTAYRGFCIYRIP